MQWRAVGTGVFFVGASVAIACGSNDAPDGFDLAFEIEGNGSLYDSLDGGTFRCDGPKDCGTVHFSGGSVVINVLPAAGNGLESWDVDGEPLENEPASVSFDARPSSGRSPRFAPRQGGETETGPIACGAETCTGGAVCCVPRESSAADGKPPFCAPSFAACSTGVPATCLANKDCTTPDTVCCAIASDVGIKLRLACTARTACRDVELLCGSCEAPFYTCNQINYTAQIGVCVDPSH